MRYLTFALTKGRLAGKTMKMLESLGITCEEMKEKDSRKLIFTNEELKYCIEYFKKNRTDKERLFYSRTKRNLTRFHIYRYIEEIAKEADLEKAKEDNSKIA